MYQLLAEGGIRRLADGACIPADPGNTDYRGYLKWAKEPGNDALPADPEPELEVKPSRDERLLAAVAQAKAAVGAGSVFTKQQAVVLAAAFDGLGAAIAGEGG